MYFYKQVTFILIVILSLPVICEASNEYLSHDKTHYSLEESHFHSLIPVDIKTNNLKKVKIKNSKSISIKTSAAWPAAGWVARAFWNALRFFANYSGTKALDWFIDRSDLLDLGITAKYELEKHCNSRALTNNDCQWMKEIVKSISRINSDLRDNGKSDLDVNTIVKKHIRNLSSIEERLAEIDRKLFNFELKQRQIGKDLEKNRRLIADNHGRIIKLENQIVDHQRRIVNLEGRVVAVEGRLDDVEGELIIVRGRVSDLENEVEEVSERLNREHGKYDKHIVYIGGNLSYANTTYLDVQPTLGAAIDLQYNISQYFGITATLSNTPFWVPSDDIKIINESERGTNFIWDNFLGLLGVTTGLIPPHKSVSLHLGVSGGISVHSLVEVPNDNSLYDRNQANETFMITNIVSMARMELGFSPHLYSIEPYLSGGIIRMLNKVSYENDIIGTNLGANLWFLAIGVRYRFTPKLNSFE